VNNSRPGDDLDGDGLSDLQEFQLGSNASSIDSDNDGIGDYEEVHQYGTDPANFDSDNDGISDLVEITNGSNPLLNIPAILVPINALILGQVYDREGQFNNLALIQEEG